MGDNVTHPWGPETHLSYLSIKTIGLFKHNQKKGVVSRSCFLETVPIHSNFLEMSIKCDEQNDTSQSHSIIHSAYIEEESLVPLG